MSIKRNSQFTGKVNYIVEEPEAFIFDDEDIDVTEEIERTLNEIKNSLKISDKEIKDAIDSRKNR